MAVPFVAMLVLKDGSIAWDPKVIRRHIGTISLLSVPRLQRKQRVLERRKGKQRPGSCQNWRGRIAPEQTEWTGSLDRFATKASRLHSVLHLQTQLPERANSLFKKQNFKMKISI